MELRLIEIYYPENGTEELQEILEQYPVLDVRYLKISDSCAAVKVLLPEGDTEKFTDEVSKKFNSYGDFRLIIMGVNATIPRPKEPEKEEKEDNGEEPEEEAKKPIPRISREELYSSISSSAKITRTFIIMAALSAIVAALGIQQNNMVIIIGAMVIAPLLGPNIAFALATTLGDAPLARQALKASAVALFIVLAISVVLGFILKVTPDIPEIAARTKVNFASIIVALASGCAGALAFTTSIPTALVGVMVAVAILPPLVTFGMLLGQGLWIPAANALLLAVINIVCINLAGVGTFVLQGIRPANWWEAERAKKATRTAAIIWVVLLLLLAGLIVISQR